jgi:hypothetical protein
MCKNDWGPTTGKHMNFLDEDKKSRLDSAVFEQKLQDMLARHIQE